MASAGINLLTLRRARQTGRARQGEQVPLPVGHAATVEVQLRSTADPNLVSTARTALEVLATSLDRTGLPAPPVEAVLVGSGRVELVLTTPAVAPPPWLSDEAGRRWTLTRSATGGARQHGRTGAYPALVPVGRDRASGDHVLANLECYPVIAVTGDPDAATALLQAWRSASPGCPGRPTPMSS